MILDLIILGSGFVIGLLYGEQKAFNNTNKLLETLKEYKSNYYR